MRKDSKGLGLLDQNLLPLSSNLIRNKQDNVHFKNMKNCKPGEQGYFLESYQNKYFKTYKKN